MTHLTAMKSSLAVVSCNVSQLGDMPKDGKDGDVWSAGRGGEEEAWPCCCWEEAWLPKGKRGGGAGRFFKLADAAAAQRSLCLSAMRESRLLCCC